MEETELSASSSNRVAIVSLCRNFVAIQEHLVFLKYQSIRLLLIYIISQIDYRFLCDIVYELLLHIGHHVGITPVEHLKLKVLIVSEKCSCTLS